MNIYKTNQLFTDKELIEIKDIVNKCELLQEDPVLGRLIIDIDLPSHISSKFIKFINEVSPNKLRMGHITCVKYSNQYGQPNLPPHFDGSKSNMMIDFQLESNTCWDLGVNTEIYTLEDNSLLAFNPNENIHWRPHKKFNDGEYVKMIFVRFANLDNLTDYSHMAYTQNDPIFEEANKFRDSLKS